MGKFDGVLICSDIDGTLIDDNFKIPKANLDAVSYFKSEGGFFTLATGRTPQGVKLYIDKINPNAPVVCQNGSGIYDFSKEEYIWTEMLPEKAHEIIDFIEEKFPKSGIEVICEDEIYYVKENNATAFHQRMELFDVTVVPYKDIKTPWIKILIAEEPSEADKIEETLKKSRFAEEYRMVRSYSTFYEILEKSTNKGNAVNKLCEILGIDKKCAVSIGDNDNDSEMLTAVENSYAVLNASSLAKKSAKYLLDTDNNTGAIARLIEVLEKDKNLL